MNGRLTRVELLRRGMLGVGVLAVPGLAAACGGGGGGIEGAAETTAGGAATGGATGGATSAAGSTAAATVDRTLASKMTISNWPLYIDVNEETGKRPTLDAFTKEYGVEVEYIEDINSNEEFFGKIQGPLAQGSSIDRDIIIPTGWMAARLHRLGYLEAIDRETVKNATNIDPNLAPPTWDPERQYSMPWQSYMTGIGYDPERVGEEITSVSQLLDNPKLKGKVTFLNEMGDSIGLLLSDMGADPTKVDPAAFDEAIKRLEQGVSSGQIRQFTGNDYTGPLAKGDLWACMAWSGDIVQLQADNPNLRFVIPEKGGAIGTDYMLVPKGGNVFTASTFMDFVYRPEIAAQIAVYVNYVPPLGENARAESEKLDPDVAGNQLVFPDAATLSRLHEFDPAAIENEEYRQRFQAVVGA